MALVESPDKSAQSMMEISAENAKFETDDKQRQWHSEGNQGERAEAGYR